MTTTPQSTHEASADRADAIFGLLEDALRYQGRLLPLTPDQIEASDVGGDRTVSLPDALTDPAVVLARGKELLQYAPRISQDEFYDDKTTFALMEAACPGIDRISSCHRLLSKSP